MDVRIGVTQAPRELTVEMADDERDDSCKAIEAALAGAVDVLWLTDKRGREVGVPRPRSPTSRSARTTATAASASAADRPQCQRVRMDLLDRQLLFVTGKGGVGKTSVAAALAELARPRRQAHARLRDGRQGRARGGVRRRRRSTFEPREIDPDLFGMAMNTEDSLREYLRLFVKVPLVGRIGPLARTFDFVADAAPGVKEILAVGKLAYEVRERHYDLVVVDAEASGHIVAQIGAPRVISELVQVGMVRDQTRWMIDILEDPAPHRARHRHDARGDAGHGDDRPARPARPRDRRGAVGDRRQPRAAGAVRPPPGRGRRPARRGRGRCSSTPPGPACARCSPPPTSPRPAGASAAATSSGCAPAARRPARALRARAVHPRHRPPRRRAGRRGARRGTGRARDAPRASTATDPAGSTRCWREGDGARARIGRRRQDDASPPRSALAAAVHQGGKVLVLTVDPAKRLADALGVGALGNTADAGARRGVRRRPASSRAASCGRRCSTRRRAGTSSSAATRPTPRSRDAVLSNPLYQNITSRFVHSHDYLAMEQLHDLHATGRLRPRRRRHAAVAQRARRSSTRRRG